MGGVKFPQGEGSMVIYCCKKNDLLYKDITCLCNSLPRLWVLCLMVLFLLGLGFAPSSVLGVSLVLFYAFVHRTVVFDGSFLFSNWRGCFFCWMPLFRPTSFWFYFCRHIVGFLLMLWIVYLLGFPGAFCSTRSSSYWYCSIRFLVWFLCGHLHGFVSVGLGFAPSFVLGVFFNLVLGLCPLSCSFWWFFLAVWGSTFSFGCLFSSSFYGRLRCASIVLGP